MTAVFTGRASFKAAELIEGEYRSRSMDYQDKAAPELPTKEKVKLVWPLYVAPVSIGTTTIVAILLANHEASKKVAALTVASGISERALSEYKAKVAEKITKAKQTEIRDEIAKDRIDHEPPPINNQIVMAGDGDVLCHDMLTGRYFKSDMEKLRQAQNDLNYEIIAHEYASLSFFCDLIGLAPTPYTDIVGWRVDDHPELSFSTVMSPDDRPCIAIDYEPQPHLGYNQLW